MEVKNLAKGKEGSIFCLGLEVFQEEMHVNEHPYKINFSWDL